MKKSRLLGAVCASVLSLESYARPLLRKKKTNYRRLITIVSAMLLGGSLAGGANASVIFSQNGNEITMEIINEAYTLTTNQTDNILYVAFLDVFLPGGGSVSDSSRVSGTANYSVNGGLATPLSWWGGWQYRPGTQFPWTAEDAAFLLDLTPNTLLSGDTILVNGILTMNTLLDSDIILPDLTGIVDTVIGGHSSLYSGVTTTTLSTTVVPIPAALWLFGSGLLGLVGMARRRRA